MRALSGKNSLSLIGYMPRKGGGALVSYINRTTDDAEVLVL